jgi:hypothetical protein
MVVRTILGFTILLAAGCSNTQVETKVTPAQIQEISNYIAEHGQEPTAYVVSKFADHDVVILGEMHRVKHDPEFVSTLIPVLHENGVNILATEFARKEDQWLIDSLLSGDEYDEQLARTITFNQFVFWGYQEYVDIFKAAWEVNHDLNDGEPVFRILGMNCSPDFSVFKKPEDRDNDSLKKLLWRGCGEKDWADVVLAEVEEGRKVLAYCGIHHAFSEYKQPVVIDGKFVRFGDSRMGNYVYRAIGKRAITVYLHDAWTSREGYAGTFIRPLGGIVDRVVAQSGASLYPVAFDVKGSPFEAVVDSSSVYSQGYTDFTLADFCDGYVYQKPFSEYEAVTPIADFINEGNIDVARQQSPNPRFRNATIEAFNDGIARDAERHKSWLREL